MGNVQNMNGMFLTHSSKTAVFNQDISSWNVSSVTNMGSMFYGTTAFNQDISSWDTSSVTNMISMFRDATAFDQNLNAWDVS